MVQAPADYAEACALGRRLAADFLSEMRTRDLPGALGHAVKAMAVAGRFGGVEIGFLHVVGQAAIDAESVR
jgi:hypothetical protein